MFLCSPAPLGFSESTSVFGSVMEQIRGEVSLQTPDAFYSQTGFATSYTSFQKHFYAVRSVKQI